MTKFTSKMRVALVQKSSHKGFDKDLLATLEQKTAQFICFPEYCFVPESAKTQIEAARHFEEYHQTIRRLSTDFSCTIIGGSAIEQSGEEYYNSCVVYTAGKYLGSYRKIHLFHREVAKGLSPGDEYKIFEVAGIRFGVLICADVLSEESFRAMRKLQTDLIFVPVTSPYRTDDTLEKKLERDKIIFERGAQISGSYVIKVSAVGTLFGGQLQGRSLVAAPWGVLLRVPENKEKEEMILYCELDLETIRTFRTSEYFLKEEIRVAGKRKESL